MLQALTDGIWVVDHPLTLFGIQLDGRMTLVRLDDASLMVVSPGPMNDALKQDICALGQVSAIVAPNRFHHLYVKAAQEYFPEAKTFAAPGLEKKRSDIAFDAVIDAKAGWPGVEAHIFGGLPMFNEVVLFHKASSTLILTDLMMNVPDAKGLLSKLMYWLEGVSKRPRVPRIMSLMCKDRAAARASAQWILEQPVQRIILAHGYNILENEAPKVLKAAFQPWADT